ncbi:hypothetical protein M501DRAFT_1010571 [Patellaria atrata CBS 101060]|uniref:Uncharacterized protein n=1 Tax=Patellaria atrata CBS 101060 TaxID=1346257 RepID=A0A9P4SD34_9PEZI|nr:hypothetical protein M501DRAFT_1010571 [Patellaria atrata CBS 101060]
MASYSTILGLSNELLRDILDYIEADPEKFISVDRRAYLSQESFKAPERPPPNQAQNLASFRLTCRRFSELGAIHQFARVTTRFSRHGLERLENIAGQPHLAKHVKKFSYMVPYFYIEGRGRVQQVLPTLQGSLGSLNIGLFVEKFNEQREIVQTEEDERVLKKALSAFTSLQHVQILRVQDQQDGMLLSYIRRHNSLNELLEIKWAPACSHSTRTLGAAMLATRSPCSRFSSPMLSPQSALGLSEHQTQFISALAERLTCLELHFDDGTDLDERMGQLSGLFKAVFTSARNLQAVHLGFPSHRPLSLKLEDIFHNVRWEKLIAFGIQAWKLDADEIIGLARRHKDKLKGLRLRDVLMKDGSMWKDVLAFLREEMQRLDWVSLRRIGYAKQFEEQWAMGAEIPDDPPGGASDSSDENDDNDDVYDNNDDHESDISDSVDSGEQSESDDEHGPNAHELDFPGTLMPDTPASATWCRCGDRNSYPESAEELGDDGVFVSNTQRKMWEKWVVRGCPEHGSGS